MGNKKTKREQNKFFNFYTLSFIFGIVFMFFINTGLEYTESNEYCESCHVHPQADKSWRQGSHVYNRSGVKVNCVECHLPASGVKRITAKISTGLNDVYGYLFKDSSSFNWEEKSQRESAIHHVYKSSCIKCHQNMFPPQLSKKGEDAHLYYDSKKDNLRCINCHLEVGHYHEKRETKSVTQILDSELYTSAATVESFSNFIETIPGSNVDFEMVAIPGGTFKMGSPANEEFRREDEGPQVDVTISKFWMGKIEVSWDEYSLFMRETGKEGRTEDQVKRIADANNVDAISGPTPFYGNADQGWGKGKRPAITMSYYGAVKYCEWLSSKTKKHYRLPTEAEWEYAARANTTGAYFFEGVPANYSNKGFWNSIFGADTTMISEYVIYNLNSSNKTLLPSRVKENPFGLKQMLGNVREICSDFYSNNIYKLYTKKNNIENPTGPTSGDEFVVRGGSFKSDASNLRIATRDHSKQKEWLITDPQIPKSIWWYSDCNDVGFRVVLESK